MKEIEARTKEYHTEDLFNWIQSGKEASWTVKIQVMPEREAETYRYDVTDVTKIWPHADYPLITIGRFALNENPTNFFA